MKHKYLRLTLFTTVMYATVIAQPTIKHQKAIGGNDVDQFRSMYITKDGGLIVGGYSTSNISSEKTENNRGLDDYWIVKLDSTGKIEWDKTIGGSNWDFLYSIQQTSDGGYVLGGSSYSNVSGEKTEQNRCGCNEPPYSSDYWVVKLDKSGTIQWDKTIGGRDYDILQSLQQTSDGGYILGGYSTSNASGEKTQNSRGASDYWIVKLNGLGKIQWDKTIGGSDEDDLSSLQQTSDGGLILGGTSSSNISGEKTDTSRGFADYWVVKLDNSGKIQWDKTIGGNYGDALYSLQQSSDHGYILGGESFSNKSGEKTEYKRHGTDYWAVKLDSLGGVQWDKTIGGYYADKLTSLQQTIDGGYILGGSSGSSDEYDKTEKTRGRADYWVVKLNSFGEIQWDKTIGGDSYDYLFSIKEVKKNDYLLGGYSYSKISGDRTEPSRGGNDYWLVELKYKTQDTFAVTTLQNSYSLRTPIIINNKSFTLYPNPAKNMLHIQTDGKATLSLTNQAGKVLLTKAIDGTGIINVAALPEGLYYLKNNANGEVQKVIVAK